MLEDGNEVILYLAGGNGSRNDWTLRKLVMTLVSWDITSDVISTATREQHKSFIQINFTLSRNDPLVDYYNLEHGIEEKIHV